MNLNEHKRISFLLIGLVLIVILPLFGGLIYYGGQFPKNFFQYPILAPHPKPPFSWYFFIGIAFFCLLILLLYLFPRLFGFKRSNAAVAPLKKQPLPFWFYIGLSILVFVLIVMWGKLKNPRFITHYGSTLFYWALFLIVDSLLYRRNNRHSLLKDHPRMIIALGLSSAIGWVIYAYLNFFLDENWYYPNGNAITGTEFYTYLLLASSALVPLMIETFLLLRTVPKLRFRYSNGPKIRFNKSAKWITLILSLIFSFVMGIFPHQLFFFVWLGPLVSLAVILDLAGFWSPFKLIGQGNWNAILLVCLAGMIQGTTWECYNYFSADHSVKHNPEEIVSLSRTGYSETDLGMVMAEDKKVIKTERPDYWVYNVPYVNRFFVFEMPVLGLFGYLPYGAYGWIFWIVFCFLLKIEDVGILDYSNFEGVDK